MDKFWKSLQNGSDIRGVAMEGIAGEEINLSTEVVTRIACGFVQFLVQSENRNSNSLSLAVGHDSRITGPSLASAIIEALLQMGCRVLDFGLASTPAMFMSTLARETRVDGAIMLTASHLPFNRNGMKFFISKGGLEKENVTKALELAQKGEFPVAREPGSHQKFDFMPVYAATIRETICKGVQAGDYDHPLAGLHIIVDAGNGAGGFYAGQVLKPLGADITGSQFLEPDGRFPNHIPNPENQQAMNAIVQASIRHNADLGIIFDTDVDRAAVVDDKGMQINRNRLVALMAAIVLKEHPGSVIVTDSITSDGLTEFIQGTLKGEHRRFKRGYRNVINESLRLNAEGKESWLAIETSGHAAMKENYFLDDGAYMVSRIVIELARLKKKGQELGDLLHGLREPVESQEFRLNITEPDFAAYGQKVIAEVEEFCRYSQGWSVVPDNCEGTRISCNRQKGFGWFLLRLSLHDPVLPLNVESDEAGGIDTIMHRLSPLLEKFDGLDTSGLKVYI